MPHDTQIIEAGRKFLIGRGAETMVSEPSVGGGESPDWIAWFRPESGSYYTEVVECKRSIADARRELDKGVPAGRRMGNMRWMFVPADIYLGDMASIARRLDMGVICWHLDTSVLEVKSQAPFRKLHDSAVRSEQRILHDHLRKLELRLRELEGPGPKRGKGNGQTGLRPYHHDILDSHAPDVASEREVMLLLRHYDPKLTRKAAAALAHEAVSQGSPGFKAAQHGQDMYLERVAEKD